MAFVHDIEADRIDDFNLFQAFVRVPLLILGGVLGGKSDGSSSKDDSDENEDMGMDDSASTAAAAHPLSKEDNDDDADDDDAMDCSSSSSTRLDSTNSVPCTSENIPPNANSRIVSDTDIDETDMDAEGLTRSKKMSWSDSVGLRLVEYNDEVRQTTGLCCLCRECHNSIVFI